MKKTIYNLLLISIIMFVGVIGVSKNIHATVPIINSTESTAETVAEPDITEVTIRSTSSFNVTISRVNDASGYYIYNIEDDGTLTLLKTVDNNYTSRIDVDELTYENTYKLTVQAYKNLSTGETITSTYNQDGIVKKLVVTSNYKNGLKYFYDAEGNVIKNTEYLLAKKNKKYMIKVNVKRNVVTVYAKDGIKGYTIPVKSFLCSAGQITPLGTFSLGDKSRYRVLFHNCYSQWTIGIHNNILFHTSPYKSYKDNNTLDVAEYNKLGTLASHGCVRLQCENVKWLYDNCKKGTKVVIYKSKTAGPFGKPKLTKLPKWHTWDPTDPTAIKKCIKKNCEHL